MRITLIGIIVSVDGYLSIFRLKEKRDEKRD
jgi:hypothetical protein